MERMLFSLTLLAALGCGVMAGVFFTFSVFVMPALNRVAPSVGIASMQSINVAAITPLFMLTLFGTAAACIAIVIAALLRLNEAASMYMLTGSLLYLIGAILVTMIFNVPRNDALAAVSPASADAAALWVRYIAEWTAWNHVRAATSLAATASLVLALTRWR